MKYTCKLPSDLLELWQWHLLFRFFRDLYIICAYKTVIINGLSSMLTLAHWKSISYQLAVYFHTERIVMFS